MIACASCAFFGRLEGAEDEGTCRRWAPRPVTIARDGLPNDPADLVAAWPTVLDSDWCGEHQERA